MNAPSWSKWAREPAAFYGLAASTTRSRRGGGEVLATSVVAETSEPQRSDACRVFRRCVAEVKFEPKLQSLEWAALSVSTNTEIDHNALVRAVRQVLFEVRHSGGFIPGARHGVLFLTNAQGNQNYTRSEMEQPILGTEKGVPDWMLKFYDQPRTKASRASLRSLVLEMRLLLSGRKFQVIDRLLANSDFGRLPPEIIVGLVRSTAVARSYLASWRPAVTRAAEELRDRDLPADDILIGLHTTA